VSTSDIGLQYDLIAEWWNRYHKDSNYGVAALERALAFARRGGAALDVGCGSGGRLFGRLQAHGLRVSGIDASKKMIELAKQKHPEAAFTKMNVIDWKSGSLFDFILSWDCLFHLPLGQQAPVLTKLCESLRGGGVLLYSFGDAQGTHHDSWRGQAFRYSSLGVTQNLEILHRAGMKLRHLEIDQCPEKHVYAIAQKL
jgi:2-polyprenyl-3-methyl-5-hydroxy-6-metoxy-1,4-benzoquinol methylase